MTVRPKAEMEMLEIVNLRDGRVLDEVALVAGELRYRTGASRPLFETLRANHPELTDADIFARYTNWTNGYLAVRVATEESADQ